MIIGEQEDTILIQNTLDGNQIAQRTLYEKYKKIVKSFIRKKYSIIFELDDDVSEIMIKIFMNLKDFDKSKSNFRSWVICIAKNYMIDKWRCSSITFTSLDNPAAFVTYENSYTYGNGTGLSSTDLHDNNVMTITNNGVAFSANSTYAVAASTVDFEHCNSISHISNQLSPVDYTLLDMKYNQGFEYCEIGKEFNLSSNTVSNRVNYLKSKIKKNNLDLIYD